MGTLADNAALFRTLRYYALERGLARVRHKWRQRAVVVPDKGERVYNFHRRTVAAMQEVVATVGLDHPGQLRPEHLCRRTMDSEIHTADQVYRFLETGELLTRLGDGRPKVPSLVCYNFSCNFT